MASVPEKKKRVYMSLDGFSDQQRRERRTMQVRAHRAAKGTTPKNRRSWVGLSVQEKRDRIAAQVRAHRDAKRTTPKAFSRAGLSDQEKRARRAAQAMQWRKNNETHARQNSVVRNNNRRARKLAAAGSYTNVEWTALCAQYGDCCACCKQQKPLTADHVVPLSKGGSNDIGNIQPLCRSCNSRKATKTVDYR